MLKHLGLLLILIGWVMAAVLILKWRNKDLSTISGHGASSKKASILFAATLIGIGVPFYFWIIAWLSPFLKLGVEFTLVTTLAVVLNVITASVLDSPGWRKIVHRSAATAMFILFFIMAIMIVNSSVISAVAQTIGWSVIAYLLISGLLVAFSAFARRNSLIFQTLFLVSVHLVILSAVYL